MGTGQEEQQAVPLQPPPQKNPTHPPSTLLLFHPLLEIAEIEMVKVQLLITLQLLWVSEQAALAGSC